MNPSPLKNIAFITLTLCNFLLWPVLVDAQEDNADIKAAPTPSSAASDIDNASDTDDLPDANDQPFDTEAYLSALADKARYEQVITDLELLDAQNAYSSDLAQAWLNLAGTLKILEEYDAAANAYDMALQTIRISNGLSSLQQIPILEELRVSNEFLEDWEGVDANNHLIYHINLRNFPPGDERRLQSLEQLGNWKLKVASEELLGGFTNYAGDAAELYSVELRLLEDSGDFEDKNLYIASLNLGEAKAKLLLAEQILEKPLRDYEVGGKRTITQQRCYTVRLPNNQLTQVCETVEVPNMAFYIEPSNRKMQELNMNLLSARKSIMRAWEILQVESGSLEKRDSLLAEVQQITTDYNRFMTENSL